MLNIDKYKNPEKRKQYMKDWRQAHPDYCQSHWRKWYNKTHDKALLRVGNGKLECSRCGEIKKELLEINHKKGGGNIERKQRGVGGLEFYRLIANKKRTIEDLELLCRPCNLVHAAELISGRKYIFAT